MLKSDRKAETLNSDILQLRPRFHLVALTPPGLPDPSIAIAACRAGGIGILDLEYTNDTQAAIRAIERMIRWTKDNCGIKLNSHNESFITHILSKIPDEIKFIIFTAGKPDSLSKYINKLRLPNRNFILEITSLGQARLGQQLGVDGLIAKGSEAPGFIGEMTSFILLQQILSQVSLPIWVQGGIGLHTAAACYAAGATGVVLDSQLFLARESPFSDNIKRFMEKMDGCETLCMGNNLGFPCRLYARPGINAIDTLLDIEKSLEKALESHNRDDIFALWNDAIQKHAGWNENGTSLWIIGQNIAFSSELARQFGTVGAILQVIGQTVHNRIYTAKLSHPLNKESLLAKSHGTIYPIVQGPMARVSDNAEFSLKVAEGGALPIIALSTLKSAEARKLLEKVCTLMGKRPWGVGLLGFIENDLLKEQLEVLETFRPPFAVVAGGLPNLVMTLESKGTSTYVHIPSPDILEMFIESGAKKFIFEGNECGGHIGPRSSFILWDIMIEKLLKKFAEGYDPEKFHILFAGGIHDSISAAMVSTLSTPLVSRGVRIGVLMGTAYLLTEEIVKEGAIVKGFQEETIRCSHTKIIETGPGYAIRCSATPFVRTFENEKRRLQSEKLSPEKIRSKLEELILGRLRIASKGVSRKPSCNSNSNITNLIPVSEKEQHAEGIYMLGQLAALRDKTYTIKDLHHDVAENSSNVFVSVSSPEDYSPADYSHTNVKNSAGIAIIGMACMFPKAMNLRTYWENILDKVNAISEIPPNRWDWRLYFDGDLKAKDKIYSKWGGFLDDLAFDPLKYGIPPSTLSSIEPLHLMTLEVVNAALQDAGYKNNRRFPREKTSVILGTGSGIGDLGQRYIFRSTLPQYFNNHSDEILGHLPEWTEDSFPGILMNVLAGRVANCFNLGGVNYTIDAACASSLAALYDGVKELESGNSDMVIAGGVDACQSAFTFLCFSKTHALSPRGKCQVFDEKADGTVISEGLGVVILKRLSDAERDGDRIYAVIKSVAGSSDGRGKSMTAPRLEGQLMALNKAYAKAGFSAATIGLLEAHGTGTTVGDQVESQSASQLLIESKAANQSCAIGSVKSMIGHTKGAAGMAGLIKIALSLYYKVLPPTIGIDKPNPKTNFLEGPLYLNTEPRPWIGVDSHPRRAGVNAFGFGGTNFHAVLEEYSGDFTENKQAVRKRWTHELLLWAVPSRNDLISALEPLKQALSEGITPPLEEIALSLYSTFKDQGKSENNSSRLAIVASSPDDLNEKLTFVLQSLRETGRENILDNRGIYFTEKPLIKSGKIAFLFPGQGSQYVNMLRELTILFPEICHPFEYADTVLKDKFPKRISNYIFPPPCFSTETEKEQMRSLAQTNIAQPALGAACYGMFKLLQNVNLKPDMVAGHSYGEYVALCAAGVFNEKTLYELSETRGRLIIEAAHEKDLGTMAAVKAGALELREFMKDMEDVVIANINAPKQTVISGKKTAVARAIEFFKSRNIQAQEIPVAGAFHSGIVAPAKEKFSHFLRKISFAPPEIQVFSNTFAAPYAETQKEIESCLVEHMVRPVEFVKEIEAMYERGARVFIEVGPGSVLTNLTKQILEGRLFLAAATDIRENSALAQLLKTFGQLAVNGVSLSLDRLYKGRELKDTNPNALAEKEPKKLSLTTWLINGSSIRPAHQTGSAHELYKKSLERKTNIQNQGLTIDQKKPDTQILSEIQSDTQSKPESSNRHITASQHTESFETAEFQTGANTDSADAVMLQYQQLMNRFLETQKGVMLAYLQGTQQSLPSITVEQQTPSQKEKRILPKEPANIPSSEIKKAESPVSQASPKQNTDKENMKTDLIRIVSERTGYPPEMLNPDSDIEADLGIDSIKRVEILSAFTKLFPATGQQKIRGIMEDLSKLKTFKAIVDRCAETLGTGDNMPDSSSPVEIKKAESPVSQASPKQNTDKENMKTDLIRIVSERTGYPPEMLNPDSDIEADLGIDSIKRVEILSAFTKLFPATGQQKIRGIMEDLSKLKTFKAIVDRCAETLGTGDNMPDSSSPVEIKKAESPVSQASPKQNTDKENMKTDLIRIVSERTGYPPEMLNPDSDIEADLGIDSIKRVEILSAFTKLFPATGQQKIRGIMEDLSKLKTFKAILDRCAETLGTGFNVTCDSEDISSPEKIDLSSIKDNYKNVIVPRFLFESVTTLNPEENSQSFNNGLFIITDDGRGVADALALEIKNHGGKTVILKMNSAQTKTDGQIYSINLTDPNIVNTVVQEIRHKHGPVIGLIHLLPLEDTISFKEMDIQTWRNILKVEVKSLFYLARALGNDLRNAGKKGGGWLVAATALSSHFNGTVNNSNHFIGQAGIPGLLKTVSLEWPEVTCKAINLDMTNTPLILSSQLLREISTKDHIVEVEYRSLNRILYKAKPAPLDKVTPEKMQINKDWIILVTGGAVGITAEVAYELAVKYQPTLLLVGRSPFPNDMELPDTAHLTSPKDIKAVLIEKLRVSGNHPTPASIEAACLRLLKDREIRQNVTRMKDAGATVQYFQADVRDEQKFGELIDEIYRQYGRLDGIIHGAGIIEDKLLEDKSTESFDRVLDTKVDSAFILSRKVRPESLKFIAFFTSVAGCFGNRGQSDYATANEIVNKLAMYLDKQWKCRILAINWGPWKKTGMVTPEVERQFKERDIQLIPPHIGTRIFEEEIRYGDKGDVKVAIGDGPWMT